jgi:Fic family protein
MTILPQVKNALLGYSLSLDDYTNLSSDDKTHFQNDFIYQSNYIEGISDHWVQTVRVGEQPVFPPTLTSHQKALDYIMQNVESEIIPTKVTNLHKILMTGLLPEKEAGHLRKKKVIIGKRHYDFEGKFIGTEVIRRCPDPESLPYLMDCYQDSLKQLTKKDVTQEDLLENHAYFEWIHPFIDGNGRTGRLLLNWLSLAHRKEFYVIESGKRHEYYKVIQSLEKKFNKKHPKISAS